MPAFYHATQEQECTDCNAGPTTAAGMAAAKGWKTAIVPSLLVGTLGYAIATFLAVWLGTTVLQYM